MGRPRKFATDAARQAACRQRLAAGRVWVDRAALEALVAAVEAAAAAGDPVAIRVRTGTADSLLRNLARHFETCAGAGTFGQAPSHQDDRETAPGSS
jgi:hypothetical protein